MSILLQLLPRAVPPALVLWSDKYMGKDANNATIAQDPNMETFARWWYNRLVQSVGTIGSLVGCRSLVVAHVQAPSTKDRLTGMGLLLGIF